MAQTEFPLHNTPVVFAKSAAFDAQVPNVIVPASGVATIDFRLGNSQTLAVSEAVAITLVEPNGVSKVDLELAYAGNFTPTFVTSIEWPGGTEPTWTKVNAKTDLVLLKWTGAKWRGAALLNYTT